MRRFCTLLLALLVLLPGLFPLRAAPAHATPDSPRLRGGDSFGYVYRDSTESDGPSALNETTGVNWRRNMQTQGTGVTLNTDSSVLVDLGFSFNFYGQVYQQVRINENGYLTFGVDTFTQDNGSGVGDPLPPNLLVAPWFDALTVLPSGTVHYITDDTANGKVFVVQWSGMRHNDYPNNADTITFQVALFQTSNKIQFRYLDTSTNNTLVDRGRSASVGLENDLNNQNTAIWLAYCNEDGWNGDAPCNIQDRQVVEIIHPDSFGAQPDLTILKQGTPSVQPGDPITYTISFSNRGSRLAPNVKVTDTLPSGFTYSSASPAPVSSSGGVLVWNIGDVPIFGGNIVTRTLTIYGNARTTVQVNAPLVNQVTIGSDRPDFFVTDNRASVTTEVRPGPPVQMTITHLPTTIPANGTTTAQVTVDARDIAGNAIANFTPMTVTTSLGTWTSNGQQSAYVGSIGGGTQLDLRAPLTPGVAQVRAYVGTISATKPLTITAALPQTITVTADPVAMLADGTSTSVITIRARDNTNNPVSDGTTINVTASPNLGVFTGTSSNNATVTTSSGNASLIFRTGTTAGTVTIQATSNARSGSATIELTSPSQPSCPYAPDVAAPFGVVDINDMMAIVGAWHTRLGDVAYHDKFDLVKGIDANKISLWDVMVVAEAFGRTCVSQ